MKSLKSKLSALIRNIIAEYRYMIHRPHSRRVIWQITIFCILYGIHRVLFNDAVAKATNTKIVFFDGFMRYIGWVVIAFILIFSWKKIRSLNTPRRGMLQTTLCAILILAIYSQLAFIFSIGKSELEEQSIYLLTLCVIHLLTFFAIFGVALARRFYFELSFAILLLSSFFLTSLMTDYVWRYLSGGALFLLKIYFSLLNIPYTINTETFRVTVMDFDIYVGPPCAGILSMSAFTTLYCLAVFLIHMHNRIRAGRAIALYILGLVSAYILNSIRLLLIVLIGAYYSPEFAINAFHSGIGAILFLLLFMIYIYKLIPSIVKKNE